MIKKLLTSLLILISLNGISQVEVGSGAGASNKAGIVNINLGYNSQGHHIFYNQIFHLARKIYLELTHSFIIFAPD